MEVPVELLAIEDAILEEIISVVEGDKKIVIRRI